MTCPRCAGMVVPDVSWDLLGSVIQSLLHARCVNCGWVQHHGTSPMAVSRALPPVKKRGQKPRSAHGPMWVSEAPPEVPVIKRGRRVSVQPTAQELAIAVGLPLVGERREHIIYPGDAV